MKLDKTCGKCSYCLKIDSMDIIPQYKCKEGLQLKLDEVGYPAIVTTCFKWKSRFSIGDDNDGDQEIITSAI